LREIFDVELIVWRFSFSLNLSSNQCASKGVKSCFAKKKMSRPKVNLNEKEIEEKIQEFQEWIKNQPQLPQNLGRKINSKIMTLNKRLKR
jgi:hypothetical protein